MGGKGLRRGKAVSAGVFIEGVRRLGVINNGVNRCDKRDSIAGDGFSREPYVYESSL